jgi:hypothetical protein
LGPELPVYGNKPNSITNTQDMLLIADIVNTNTGAKFVLEGRAGTGGCIKNLYIKSQGGEIISEIKKYNLLYAEMLQKSASNEWYDKKGKRLYRHSSTPYTNAYGTIYRSGAVVSENAADNTVPGDASDTMTSYLPLTLSSFFNQKYWILEGETVNISFDLESSIIAAMGTKLTDTAEVAADGQNVLIPAVVGVDVAATDLRLENVRLEYDIYEMEPEAFKALKARHGNQFIYYGKEYLHRPDSIPSGETASNTVLGWKKDYITRLMASLRSTSQVNTAARPSLTNRNQCLVTKYSLEHDSTTVGRKAIEYTGGVRTYGEIVKDNGGVWNMNVDEIDADGLFTGTNPVTADIGKALAGTDDDTIGSYLMELDFESLFQDEHTLSGLKVNNNLQFLIEKSSVAELTTLDIFGEYSSRIILDLNNGLITCPDNM